jgi:hypothetical protein
MSSLFLAFFFFLRCFGAALRIYLASSLDLFLYIIHPRRMMIAPEESKGLCSPGDRTIYIFANSTTASLAYASIDR